MLVCMSGAGDQLNWYIDWQKVEASLLGLADLVEDLLAEKPRRDYLSLVAAGERGLALDHLAGWLAEDEVPISDHLRDEMLVLAEVMRMKGEISQILSRCPRSPTSSDCG